MADLAEVRWIGGGSGAGKSTVAALLGRRSGLPVVHTDLSLHPHAAALADVPAVADFVGMSMDERWLDRGPAEMLATFPWFDGAGFDLLVDGLPAGPVIVEGFRLLPRLVVPLGGRGVWLLPTPSMRASVFAGRTAEGRDFWAWTSDPDGALRNLLERDRLFTERVRGECARLGLPVVEVDGVSSAEVIADRVAALLF